jgi:hypothetical protein
VVLIVFTWIKLILMMFPFMEQYLCQNPIWSCWQGDAAVLCQIVAFWVAGTVNMTKNHQAIIK